jgi:hypothetical protein
MIGLYIGVDHWRAMNGAKLSPYRGVPLWHHVSGLFFGVLTLTWVGSGLVSMSPWGVFDSSGYALEREKVRDLWIDGGQIATVLQQASTQGYSGVGSNTAKRIASAPFAGKLFLLVHTPDGVHRVEGNTFAAAPMTQAHIELIAQRLTDQHKPAIEFLNEGDTYYYSGHEPRVFPVYRLQLNDEDQTRYYFDSVSGDLIDKIDPPRRSYRWLFEGLHRFDFTATIRARPWWDLIVVPLMVGVTVVCFTGVWMGWKRLRSQSRTRVSK